MNLRVFVTSILFACTVVPAFATKQDVSMLLLTDHYGILSNCDLEMYATNRNIEPFDPKKFNGLEYWQCFDSKNISVDYHAWINDDLTGEQYCDMHIFVMLNNEKVHEYGLRRAQPLAYCKEKKRLWNKIMKNQPYTCIGGIYVGEDKPVLGSTIRVKGWVYDSIKTKKGYDTYFGSSAAIFPGF